MKSRIIQVMGKMLHLSGAEIIENRYVIFFEQPINQMASDEACTASYEN